MNECERVMSKEFDLQEMLGDCCELFLLLPYFASYQVFELHTAVRVDTPYSLDSSIMSKFLYTYNQLQKLIA
jgi:hypothetical protein